MKSTSSKKILLDVPFYKNDDVGIQCMQVTMQCVLKYYLGIETTLNELDILSNRKDEYWTWTSQIVPALFDFGLDVKLFSKEGFFFI